MTQLAAQSSSSSGRQRFEVDVFDKLGQTKIITYTSENPGGIVEGFVSRRYGNNTCGSMDFEAKPNLTRVEAGSILYTRMDTGTSVVKTHFGVVVSNPDGRSGDRGTYQVASGKELLKRSVCDANAIYSFARAPVDASYFLRLLIQNYRHPALKYDAQRIAGLGVAMGDIDARGTNLYEAIEAILSAVEDIGENDWGADPEGYVVIRPPTGTINRLKSSVIAQFGDITSDAVVTKATIRVANEVSEGAIVSAGYQPSLTTYSYAHPEHPEWMAERSFELPKNDEGKPVIDPLVYAGFSGVGWTNSDWTLSNSTSAVNFLITDGDVNTYIRSTAVTSAYVRIGTGSIDYPEEAARYVGFAIILEATGEFTRFQVDIYYQNYTSSPFAINDKASVTFDLTPLIGRGKVEARFIAPVHLDPTVDNVDTVFNPTSATSMLNRLTIYEFRSLEVNETLLDQIARAQIRLPAIEVQEVTFARGRNNEGVPYGGYLLETPAKTLRLLGDNGEDLGLSGDIAEIVDTFTVTEGMLSRVALGQPIRSSIVRAIQKMTNGGR